MQARTQDWLPTNKSRPCPICGRTKDGDCRISSNGERVICHHPKDLRRGEVHNGWAFTHNTSDGRGGHFTIDKPRAKSRATKAKVIPLRPPTPAPTTIDFARLPEAPPAPPAHLPNGHRLDYSSTQWVIVNRSEEGKKAFYPNHVGADGKQQRKAGPDPWPLWRQEDAIAHGAGRWIFEAEGEKCADWIAAGGLVAVSQPGHNRTKPNDRADRYRALVAAKVAGLVYLADRGTTGNDFAEHARTAAGLAGLPVLVIQAEDVWPDIPDGGSIDDAHGSPAERVAVLVAAVNAAPPPAVPAAAPARLPVSFEALVETLPDGWVEHEEKPPTRSGLSSGELAGMLTKTKLLRFNEMDGLPEVQTPAGWRSVHEAAQDSAYVLLDQKGWSIGIEPIQKAVLHTARLRPFHPVRDYLLALEQDPAITPFDLDTVAEVFLGTKNTMHAAMVRAWLIGAAGRALQPGTKMDYCLVLQGPQGYRKSTFFETLASPDFHCSSVPDHELRFLMNVHSCWLFELAELETVTGRRESGRLKNLLSTAHDWIVAPYGRARERKARPSVFCGTVNKGLFLHDETGDRRFWVVPIEQAEKIDIDKLRTVRDSIWKAAVTAWRAGEKPMLTDEHVTASEQQNERFRLEDPWRDPIETYLQSTPLRPVKVTDVLNHLEVPTERQNAATAKRVREIASTLGWEYGRRRHEGGQSAGLWPPS